MKNGQSGDTGNFRNKGQSRMNDQEKLATLGTKGNQECTIRRYWQRQEQRTIKNGQSGDIGNVRYKGQSRMNNEEILATLGTKGHQEWTIRRYWQR